MTITDRDKRLLIFAGPVIVGCLIYGLWPDRSVPSPVVPGRAESIPVAEKELQRLRMIAAGLPGREEVLKQVRQELDAREAGLIRADTAPQAQAQLLQIAKQLASKQSPPLNLRSTEFGQVRAFGDAYGEIALSVTFDAAIDQLLNFMADLTAQKQAIGTTDLRVGAANPKQKTVPVRLTLTALVRRDLLPDKKAAGAF